MAGSLSHVDRFVVQICEHLKFNGLGVLSAFLLAFLKGSVNTLSVAPFIERAALLLKRLATVLFVKVTAFINLN